MWALIRITEGVFWLLALMVLAPPVAGQWIVGKGMGSAAVFGRFLADLWDFGRWRHRGRRQMPC